MKNGDKWVPTARTIERSAMDWMLTDEEILKAVNTLDAAIGFHADYASVGQRTVAQAQAKKLVEWGDEKCLDESHKHSFVTSSNHPSLRVRRYCLKCLEQLRRQVGLE